MVIINLFLEIKDPFPIFMKQDVHELLKIITRIDINNVIRHRKIGEKISPPEYKFLTDEQLAKVPILSVSLIVSYSILLIIQEALESSCLLINPF